MRIEGHRHHRLGGSDDGPDADTASPRLGLDFAPGDSGLGGWGSGAGRFCSPLVHGDLTSRMGHIMASVVVVLVRLDAQRHYHTVMPVVVGLAVRLAVRREDALAQGWLELQLGEAVGHIFVDGVLVDLDLDQRERNALETIEAIGQPRHQGDEPTLTFQRSGKRALKISNPHFEIRGARLGQHRGDSSCHEPRNQG
jgi:hypothetical protein